MPEHIRALIVILLIATLVFLYAKKTLGPMLLTEEFSRWRNAWFAITLIAFLANNFWIFITLSSLYILYIAKSDKNKFALFFALLIIIPTISSRIPNLFSINHVRVLSLVLLLPLLLTTKSNLEIPRLGKPIADKLIILMILLNTVLLMRGTTFTDALRSGFEGFTDIFLPYYAASRAIKDFNQLKKVMIALVMTCFIAGAIGAYEYKTAWLLYNPLTSALGVNWNMGKYLGREDSIRAIASLGHSIILGYIMMIALGFYLFIAQSIKSNILRLIGFTLILVGLMSSLSRGPWVGTAVLLLVFIAFGKNVTKRFSLILIALIFVLPVLNWVPGGQKIINLIPFIGETDKENVEYREKLIDRSLVIINKYPVFGVFDPKQEPEMEDMVQGEGIIDIVNSYLIITLYNGLIGLSLFVSFFSLVLITILNRMRSIKDKQSEEYLCGRVLLATLLAVLVTIFTTSGIGIIPIFYWSLAGLIYSYSRVTNLKHMTKADIKNTAKSIYSTSRLKVEP